MSHPGGGGLTAGTGPCSPPKTSPNQSGRGVAISLKRVGTTTSVLRTPPVYMKVFPVETPSKPQSTHPRHMLCCSYPPSETFVLPLSECGTHSGCDPGGGGDPILVQSALMTQPKYIVAFVCG